MTSSNNRLTASAILLERERRERSEKARPAAEAIHAVLGRGVGPADLARRLAIEVEDAGMFRNRADRIAAMASLLADVVWELHHEVNARRERDGN